MLDSFRKKGMNWKKRKFFFFNGCLYGCVYMLNIISTQILHGSNFSRPSRCGLGAQLTRESRSNTIFFTPIRYFSIWAETNFSCTHSRTFRSQVPYRDARERGEKAWRCENVWKRENAKKMLYNIMESIGGTQESGHVSKGACATWKNESALAAHRQIGRMLHNHQRDECSGTGKKGSRKPKAFFPSAEKRNFLSQLQKRSFSWKFWLFVRFALNDVTLRHIAHSIGVDLAVFRFLLLSPNIDSVFHSLVCYAFSIFFNIINFSECVGAKELSYGVEGTKMHNKTLTQPKFPCYWLCVCDRRSLNPFFSVQNIFLCDYVITFWFSFYVFNGTESSQHKKSDFVYSEDSIDQHNLKLSLKPPGLCFRRSQPSWIYLSYCVHLWMMIYA